MRRPGGYSIRRTWRPGSCLRPREWGSPSTYTSGLLCGATTDSDLNVRAAMLHVFGDVGASAAVIVGGGVILLTGWYLADPLISLAIAGLIAKGASDILRETVDILTEAAPKNLNAPQMVRDIMRVATVQNVHDLHVWSVAGGMPVLTGPRSGGRGLHPESLREGAGRPEPVAQRRLWNHPHHDPV